MMPSKSAIGSDARQRQRQEREPRRRAHRREVAEVDGQRAVADGAGRRERAIEVHAVDQRIDAEDLQAVALRLDHRGIVADADQQPVGRRRAAARWMRAMSSLGQIGEQGWRRHRCAVTALIWHSRRPASRE